MADMKIGFYGHVKQYHNLKAEIDRAIHEVLESGSYVLGPQLVKFEQELAQYMNAKETVGLNSGTDALLLTFLALGIGPGDEVITTSNTFFATAEAIWLAGATPVFVDIDPRTRNIEVTKIEDAITPRTRALVPVHLYGLPADMPAVSRIARAQNLLVIEDCAQAIGARGDSFSIGELSDAVCLSFIIQKNLGCFGDGGAVATNNADLATAVRKLRNHGSLKRSHHSIGYNRWTNGPRSGRAWPANTTGSWLICPWRCPTPLPATGTSTTCTSSSRTTATACRSISPRGASRP